MRRTEIDLMSNLNSTTEALELEHETMSTKYSVFSFGRIARFVLLAICSILVIYCFIWLSFLSNKSSAADSNCIQIENLESRQLELLKNYNDTYPITPIIKSRNFVRYRIGLISDEDKKSGSYAKNSWSAFYLQGYLTYYPITKKIEIKFDESKHKVTNRMSNAKRGLELSEIVVFNGKILTCDDKTGIIYQLIENEQFEFNGSSNTDQETLNRSQNEITGSYKLIPSLILSDGDGNKEETFKCEWLTVKDRHLYVGSSGSSFVVNKKTKYSSWIKRVNMLGIVEHFDWRENYNKLEKALDLPKEGYISHETAMWSEERKKWFFLPRKISTTAFNRIEDDSKCSNKMFEVSEDFEHIIHRDVGPLNLQHGFSSSKFLPGFNDEIIFALKTQELNDSYMTYIIVFDLQGTVLYPETIVNDELKFEGLEFI